MKNNILIYKLFHKNIIIINILYKKRQKCHNILHFTPLWQIIIKTYILTGEKRLLETFAQPQTTVQLDSAAPIFTSRTRTALSIQTTQWCQHMLYFKQRKLVHSNHTNCVPPQSTEPVQHPTIIPLLSLESMSILPTQPAIRYICACSHLLCTLIEHYP